MARNVFKSRKAISPILATLLLIVVAVAAVVVTYAWVMTYMGGAGQQAGVMLYKANVRFYGGGSNIDIDVGNSGTSNTEIIKVYAGNSSSAMAEQTPSQTLPLSLSSESIVTLTLSYSWTAGNTYYFKVVSSTGQTLEFSTQATT